MLSESRVVNTITAAPLLHLLLAIAGMEGLGDPEEVWPVFKRFSSFPSSSEVDILTFQIAPAEERGVVGVRFAWGRHLRDEAGGYGITDRLIEVAYGYYPGSFAHPQTLELWSDQYPSADAFFADVESRPEFEFLLRTAPTSAEISVEDVATDEEEGQW